MFPFALLSDELVCLCQASLCAPIHARVNFISFLVKQKKKWTGVSNLSNDSYIYFNQKDQAMKRDVSLSTTTKEDEIVKEANKILDTRKLILFNDDHNTFEHVISCLVLHCNHNTIQAEQCALIVHNKGKCDIKSGTYEELELLAEILGLEDLTVEIQ